MSLYGYDEVTLDKFVWSNVESVRVQVCTFFWLPRDFFLDFFFFFAFLPAGVSNPSKAGL